MDSNHRSNLQQIYSLSPLATRESAHILYTIYLIVKADDRTRTDNLLITNQLLCQLSHIGILLQPTYYQLLYLCLTFRSIKSYINFLIEEMGPIGLEPMTLCL